MTTYRDVTVERLAIDAEIRDLAARFSDTVNRGDVDAFGALFVDDGDWKIESPRRSAVGKPDESRADQVTRGFTEGPWNPIKNLVSRTSKVLNRRRRYDLSCVSCVRDLTSSLRNTLCRCSHVPHAARDVRIHVWAASSAETTQ